MKKFIQCSLVLLMLVLTSISNANEHFPFLGAVKRGPVNIRAGANTNFEIVTKLNEGDELVVLAKSFEWYKIQAPLTVAAFIRADYIKERDGGVGEVLGDKVNLRAKPKSESSILGQVQQGELVRLIDKSDNWWKIKPTNNTVAWIHQDFVTVKSDTVSQDQLIKPVVIPTPVVAPAVIVPAIIPVVSNGMIQALDVPADTHIHYKIVADGKPVYYLQDALFLDHFLHAQVTVEGDVLHDAKSLAYPVLKVKKVVLLL